MNGFYIKANNMNELVEEAEKMKNPKYYNQWPAKIIKEAEKYHISRVSELYKSLK